MQATSDSFGSVLSGIPLLRHHLLTLHRAEDHPFHWHELLPDEALAAAGAQEAVCGRVPAEIVIGHPLHFRINCIVASLTYHGMILHVAGLAHGSVLHHHVDFPCKDAVAVKAAKMFQVPVLVLRLGILITEDQLITAGTAWFLTVTVMSTTVELPVLPEINHVHQEFTAGAADEASRVPQFIVASPFCIHGWVAFLHAQLAAVAEILGFFVLC